MAWHGIAMNSPRIEIVGTYLLNDLLQGPFFFHIQLGDQRLLLLPYIGRDGSLHYQTHSPIGKWKGEDQG